MEEKKGFFSRLLRGLTKTRKSIARGLSSIFSGFPISMMISMRSWKKF